jgi:hypothetical protein
LAKWIEICRGPSKDASYQIAIHLAKQLQRRRFFRNQPIRKKNCLWWPCLLTDRDEIKKSSPLKLLGQMNRNLVGSIYGRFCIIKFPQSRMKGERHRLSPLMLPTKFRFIWPSGFRGDDFLEIHQSETRIACGKMGLEGTQMRNFSYVKGV